MSQELKIAESCENSVVSVRNCLKFSCFLILARYMGMCGESAHGVAEVGVPAAAQLLDSPVTVPECRLAREADLD